MKPASGVRLREYTPDDLDALVALDVACFAPPFRFSTSAMRRFVEARNAWARLAVTGSDLAGFCIVHLEQAPEAQVGYLVTIDVAKECRRRGIGDLLLAAAEGWLVGSGAAAMMLHVHVQNTEAVRFYERTGYERGGEKPGFYGPGIDAALYWKRLPR